METTKRWKDYEDLTYGILSDLKEHLGFETVERDVDLEGQRSGTTWNIEVVARTSENGRPILIECKYWKSAVPQEVVAGLVYRVMDVEADGAILVARSGLQEGAEKVAAAEEIERFEIADGSNLESYLVHFLNQVFVKETAKISIKEHIHIVMKDEDGNEVDHQEIGSLD